MTTIIICPGIHKVSLTESFIDSLQSLKILNNNYLVFPTNKYPAFSSYHLFQFIDQSLQKKPDKSIFFLSFSAGVVSAITTAWIWQSLGRPVTGLMAFDGWGVPLLGNFPIYRLSHDEFTHWSSALLGQGQDNFYADPPIPHLDLWRTPQLVRGWRVNQNKTKPTPITLSQFLQINLSQ